MASLHIAILETDTASESITHKHGSYGDVIESALRRGLVEAGKPIEDLQVSKWEVIDAPSYPPLENIDVVFVTAGRHDADQDDPWVPRLTEFVRAAYEAKKPIMGVCYGHQIIARALGGYVSRNPRGWEITVQKLDLTATGEKLFGASSLSLPQMHRDAVIQPPPEVDVIGSSECCDVQLLYQEGRLLTAQGHPEFDQLMTQEMLEERRQAGILSADLFEDASLKAGLKHDGDLFWKTVWRFLLEGRR
ncbi:Fc.00g001160.m01.CDS01 [Cosmosporella sp. VM-42]